MKLTCGKPYYSSRFKSGRRLFWKKSLFSDVIGIGGIALGTVFLVLDKAGKLKGGWLLGLLCLAGAMTLFIALGNSWVWMPPLNGHYGEEH